MNSLFLMIALLFPTLDLSPAASIGLQRSAIIVPRLQQQSGDSELRVTASFSEKRLVQPSEPIELLLGRPLKESEERLGILIGDTDVSSLFSQVDLRLRYDAKLWPLPLGESTVTVYLVSNTDEWKELASFTLAVDNERTASRERSRPPAADGFEANFIRTSYFDRFASMLNPHLTLADESTNAQEPTKPSANPARKKGKIKFVPSMTFGVTPRPVQSTFPSPGTPEQRPFANLGMQASLNNEVTYGSFSSHSTAMFAGHSVQQETLRYGDLGNAAPKIDLSSYLLQFQTGPVKYEVGHVAFGTQRHLISGVSSRGVTITIPFLKRFDFSAAAMNGTSIVGYSNFFGLNRRRHQMLGGTLGVELFAKRPSGLRLEVGVMGGHVQPLSSVSGDGIRDEKRSRGFSLRLIANDKAGRFHIEGGFTRSFSIYPSTDETLAEDRMLASNAQYLQVSYQILKDFSLSKTRKANFTVAFSEENVAPNFRSLGASPDADKIQYLLSLYGSVNEITGRFTYGGYHDNLNNTRAQPRSQNGSLVLSLAAPARALLGRTKDSPWLPALAFSFSRGHDFKFVIPVDGDFEANRSRIFNLFTINHHFKADWQIKKLTISYEYDRSLLDHQKIADELADHTTLVNTGSVGFPMNSKLKLNLDLRADSSVNRGDGNVGRTYVLGPRITWDPTSQMTLTGTFSNTIAGDNSRHSRDTHFEALWSYRFNVGKQELKKLSGTFSINYSNGYLHSRYRLSSIDSWNKNQALTTSMSFTLF